MKKLFMLVLLAPLCAFAQKIALIDRSLTTPIAYVNTLTLKQLEQGYFIMHRDNMQQVIEKIAVVRDVIKKDKEIPEEMKSLVLGDTYFTITGDKGNYGFVIDTKIDKMGSYYILSDKDKSKKKNLAVIDRFIGYLKGNM